MKKIIAIIDSKRPAENGYLKPIFEINNENNAIRVGDKDEREIKFPNRGTVYIPKEFSQIYEDFFDDEFISLEIEETSNYVEYASNICKYQSRGSNASSAKKVSLIIKDTHFLNEDYLQLPYIGHKFVFIDVGEYLMGPISILQIDNDNSDDANLYRYKVQPLNTSYIGLNNDFQNVRLKFNKSDIEKYVVTNFYGIQGFKDYIYDIKEFVKELKPVSIELTESNEEIIKWAKRVLPDLDSKEPLSTVDISDSANINQLRLARFLEIKEKSSHWLKYVDSIIKTDYLATEEGMNRINTIIENNKDFYIQQFEDELRLKAQHRISQLTDDENDKLNDIAVLDSKIKSLEQEKRILENDTELIKSKSLELQAFEKKIDETRQELSITIEYNALKSQKDRLLDDIETYRREKRELDDELKRLRNENYEEFKKGADQKVKELIPIVRALNGIYPNENNFITSHKSKIEGFREAESLQSYLAQAIEYFNQNHRNIKVPDLINILVSVQQNFLTVFSGLPGVGKTSLAELVGKFIGNEHLSHTIPVSRGWNSKKNLLGYYNPLKGEYQVDENGFVQHLRDISTDITLIQNAPFIAILDEANLSPMEYYWSDFIGLTDKYAKSINISDINGTNIFQLPNGLRFICTVNNDHTTEILSPRLIDRACVIKLSNDELAIEDISLNEDRYLLDKPFSQKSIERIFANEKVELLTNEERIFNAIRNKLSEDNHKLGDQIIISPRKIKAVINFCSVSRGLFNDHQDNQFVGLDYAVLQHILPLIVGNGKRFEDRLLELEDLLIKNSLMKSAKELRFIINKGNDFQNYSFF